jgi:hypothetical protein
MPLSDYDKSRISDWKRQIESKKIQLQNAKDEKKRDSESFAYRIKSASTPQQKASIRQSKITGMDNVNRRIDGFKKDIAYLREQIANLRERNS